jgi:hypothetical protein
MSIEVLIARSSEMAGIRPSEFNANKPNSSFAISCHPAVALPKYHGRSTDLPLAPASSPSHT